MNESTAALLDLFQIDIQAMDATRGFYRGRHNSAYEAGQWGKPIGPFGTYLADFETPDCPEGWETFRGHLARTEPLTVGLMDCIPGVDDEEEKALSALCRVRGVEPKLVSSPAWLAREGIFEALAFPTAVLDEYAAGQTTA